MRAYGYVTNTATQIYKLALVDNNRLNRRVFYIGDEAIDYDLWADAFAKGLTGKKARRIPYALLWLLGQAGEFVKKLGLPAPIDSGRVFRMSTSSAIDLSPTLTATGPVPVTFEEGVRETQQWLKEKWDHPHLPRHRRDRRAEKGPSTQVCGPARPTELSDIQSVGP
jgi:nucleoside-diphosphate-sugar epimerase